MTTFNNTTHQNDLIHIEKSFTEKLMNIINTIKLLLKNNNPTQKKLKHQIGLITQYYDKTPISKIKKNQKFKLQIESHEIYQIKNYNNQTQNYNIKKIFPSWPTQTDIATLNKNTLIITNIKIK